MSAILPHGAKGIQGDGFAIAFGDDKMVFTVKQRLADGSGPEISERHYTFHAGQKSGIIAAYQAHALVPIMVELEKRTIPEPAFLPYISPERISQLASGESAASDASIQSIADAAHEFYVRNQSVNHCAEVIAKLAIPG